MPFSDPMADGPAIQASSQRALKSGQTMKKTLQMVKAFRAADDTTPIVLMGYYNPIYVYPVDRFITDAVAAGVDGLIVVDMPPEEDAELRPPASAGGLNFIRLATPTTDAKRLPAVLANTCGLRLLRLDRRHHRHGGARPRPRSGAHVARIKAHTDLPIAVGFGVKTEDQVSALARIAEGVVVGSALVGAVAAEPRCAGQGHARATKPQVLGLVERLAAALRHQAEAAAL